MAGITKWPFLGVSIVLLAFAVTSSLQVIVITDLDFGRIPQPPRNTESDLVHVRVTSGRLGGRFFYRVSETGLPSDLPALMIPFGFFYQHTPYALLPRTDRPQQRLQPQPLLPTLQTAAASAVPPHVRLQQQRPLTLQPQQQHAVTSPFAATLASLAPLPIAAQQHHQLSQQQQHQQQQTVTPPPVVTTTTDKSS